LEKNGKQMEGNDSRDPDHDPSRDLVSISMYTFMYKKKVQPSFESWTPLTAVF